MIRLLRLSIEISRKRIDSLLLNDRINKNKIDIYNDWSNNELEIIENF